MTISQSSLYSNMIEAFHSWKWNCLCLFFKLTFFERFLKIISCLFQIYSILLSCKNLRYPSNFFLLTCFPCFAKSTDIWCMEARSLESLSFGPSQPFRSQNRTHVLAMTPSMSFSMKCAMYSFDEIFSGSLSLL